MIGNDRVWVNGEPVSDTPTGLSPLDRGFALGDGVFETMRAQAGQVFGFDRHWKRLSDGAGVLRLPLPARAEIEQLLARACADDGSTDWLVLRLSISRGIPSRRGLLPESQSAPTVVLHRARLVPYPDRLYREGMRAIVSTIPRNERSPLSRIKSLSYLDNVLARQEAAEGGADEALLLNTRGDIVGASAMNLFIVVGSSLVTPPLASGVLAGTIRGLILDRLAGSLGLAVKEQTLSVGDVTNADEAFLTNVLAGVMPLIRVDDRPVGRGQPGPWTRRLGEALRSWQTPALGD